MKKASEALSIEGACEKLQDLDIHKNSKAKATLFKVAIEYAAQTLMRDGIDIRRQTSEKDVRSFCRNWLKQTKPTDNDLTLIALVYAIQYHIRKAVKESKKVKSTARGK